ncbi:MAG: hypothetical protein IM620_18725 [Cytophagales bacterium]|nr:hypothetical protein [Cytophagales bacterium]
MAKDLPRDVLSDWIYDASLHNDFQHKSGMSDYDYADDIIDQLRRAGYKIVPIEESA